MARGHPAVTPEDTIARVRNASGKGVAYKDGKGGLHPEYPLPCDEHNLCDCSGAALWALGVSRWIRAGHPWAEHFPPINGEFQWLDTTRIVQDAKATQKAFRIVAEPEPGDLIVYGDRAGHEGHVGVISEVRDGQPVKVVHCSAGNYRATGDAIRETDVASFWHDRGAIYARPVDYPAKGVGAS